MTNVREITIDGRKVAFSASAAVPRVYRARFGRDLFADLSVLIEEMNASSESESSLPVASLEMFEDIAYTMAKHADPGIPETPEEWLDGFGMFSIYNTLPQIIEMWKINSKTTSRSKKKPVPATAQ